MRGYLPPRPSGDGADARFMQWAWDALARKLRFNSSSTVKVEETTNGIIFHTHQLSRAMEQAGASLFQIHTQYGDYYECYPWDGSEFDSSSPTNIAKPFELRNSVTTETLPTRAGGSIVFTYSDYATNTFERTATWPILGGTDSEYQVVDPPFKGSDLIVAIGVNSTQVTVSGAELTWIDLNITGRSWKRSYY